MTTLPGKPKAGALPGGRPDRVRLVSGPVGRDRKELAAHKCPPCPPGEDFPAPFAWYRGDDLDYTEGAEVTALPDRVGGIGELGVSNPTSAPEPFTFTADFINGQPGVERSAGNLRSSDGDDWLSGAISEVSIAAVLRLNDGSTPQVYVDYQDGPGQARADIQAEDGWVYATDGDDWIDYAHTDEGAGLLVGTFSATSMNLYLDGQKVADFDRTGGKDILANRLLIIASHPDVILWDRALTDEEVGQVWTYARGRYGTRL